VQYPRQRVAATGSSCGACDASRSTDELNTTSCQSAAAPAGRPELNCGTCSPFDSCIRTIYAPFWEDTTVNATTAVLLVNSCSQWMTKSAK